MNILCLSRSPAAFQTLQRYAVNLTVVDTVSALIESLKRVKCSGIILDVKCLMRTNECDKSMLYELIDAFPTLRVKSDVDGSGFIPLGDPDAFITKACSTFSPRTARKSRRTHMALPLLLARENDPKMRAAVKTCSVDLSESGIFIFSTDDWHIDDHVWIQIMTLQDSTPIHATIRWIQPWGAKLYYPGIGATFTTIKPNQHEELCDEYLLRSSNTQRLFISELSCLNNFIEQEGLGAAPESAAVNTLESFQKEENAMKTITVKGMHCPNCQNAVTDAMNQLDGVADVDVNLENGLVTFSEEKPVSDETIKNAIEKIGFEVA